MEDPYGINGGVEIANVGNQAILSSKNPLIVGLNSRAAMIPS
jgi:hypothetical protein